MQMASNRLKASMGRQMVLGHRELIKELSTFKGQALPTCFILFLFLWIINKG